MSRWRDKLPWWLLRLGARGFLMVVCAYIWFWIGLGNLFGVPAPRPGVFHLGLPGVTRAIFWWVGSALALGTAGIRRWNIIGLGGLMFMPALVIASYSVGYLAYLVDGGSVGYREAWYQVGIYGALPALVLAAALIPEPPARIVRVAHGEKVI